MRIFENRPSPGIGYHASAVWLLLTAFGIAVPVRAQQWYESPKYYNPAPFKAQEYLRFKVKYGFIRLGTVEMRQKSTDSSRYELSIRSKSASGLPFIDFDSFSKSMLIPLNSRCYQYSVETRGSNKEKISFRFDQADSMVTIKEWNERKGEAHRVVARSAPFYDGIGYVMLGRCLSGSSTTVTVASINNLEFRNSELRFAKGRDEIEIDAIDAPLQARKIESAAAWSTSADLGLSGNFTLWVSDDEAAVPLRAEVAIALGSITIELESWERKGWVPPKASSGHGSR
jgi:hypothetical protein